MPQIQQWQSRPLEDVYPVVFTDATYYSVRDNGTVKKLAVYVILAINVDGRKEVLSLEIGENENAKYRLGVLNSLKSWRLKNILIMCADGLTGLKDAVATAFPHRISALHNSSSQKYFEVCNGKRQEGICVKLEENLHSTERKNCGDDS